MNKLALTLKEKGLNVAKAARLLGLPYITVRQHVIGTRGISAKCAKRYHNILGISYADIFDQQNEETDKDTQ